MNSIWRRILLAIAFVGLAGSAFAQDVRIVFITHGKNTDLFWSIVKNGVTQAEKDMGVKVEYRNPSSGDLTEMARLIDAAVASKPDGLVVSIPDGKLLGPSIKKAIDAGIPTISINSGSDVSKQLGALMHVGQPEYEAGLAGGQRAKAAGVTKAVCVNHEITNSALEQRCKGWADGIGVPLNMLDVPADPTEIKNRVKAYLAANPDTNAILAVGPTGMEPTLAAVKEMDKIGKIYLGAFDLSKGIVAAVKAGEIAFAIDQQQYLQGYLPVVVLTLYKKYGLLPGGDVLSGPGFVTKENAAQVEKLAGTVR